MTVDKSEIHQRPFYTLYVQIRPVINQIDGRVRIQHPPDACFYLNRDFEIHSLSSRGRALSYHCRREEVLPYTVGSAFVCDGRCVDELLIEYTGRLDQVVNQVNMIQTDLVELALYAAWYPLFKGQERFEFELEVDLPSDYRVTTNGVYIQQRQVDNRTVTQWKAAAPCSDIVVLACPHLQTLERRQKGIHIEILYSKVPKAYIAAQADHLVKAIERLSGLYGPVQNKGLLRHVHSPRGGWGYARVPLAVVPEEYTLEQLDLEFGRARSFHGAAHELAHFWWVVADTHTPDDWINEGLAEYSAFRLSQEFFGHAFADALADEYREHAAQSRTDTPIAETPNSSDDRYVNRYEKTTLILLEARRRYGQEKLDSLLQALHARYAETRDATVERFLQAAEKHIGAQAGDFFSAALYQRKWHDPQTLPQ